MTAAIDVGREAFESRAWSRAATELAQADALDRLAPPDLELLAVASFMVGRIDEYFAALERAYAGWLSEEELHRAARCAFYVGVHHATRGDVGRAGGWIARAQRLVDTVGDDCVERGYLLMPRAIQRESANDPEGAYEAASQAAEFAERFGDPDLFALATHTRGLALIRSGRIADGLALLDEVMLAAVAGDLSPIPTGIVYCGAIAGCEEAFDVGRAREWTEALTEWCESQPELVSFSGRCHAHRAGLMQLRGAWHDALAEAERAQDRSERAMNIPAAGEALYQQGEVLRLRGDLTGAERLFRDANRCGREPQPGLALVRLAQGDLATAAASIERALDETRAPLQRARLLPADVEIALASREIERAQAAAAELCEIAAGASSPLLSAVAEGARGSVELAEGDVGTGLSSLRGALRRWQELGAPYEAARVRVRVASACRGLGDEDAAALELEAAHAAFVELGAAPDVALVDALGTAAGPETYGLTARELEVLRLVAAGNSNRQIAATLVLSEHTVARHVQNIRTKLRVSTRTAAAAFAFEHRLV